MARLAGALAIVFLTACGPGPGREFALPPGDPDRGKAAFVELECNACHSIADIPHLSIEEGGSRIDKRLGGAVSRVKTYEELVTSIINPSHKLATRMRTDTLTEVADESGRSRMRNYNDIMTVRQLIDLTEFLRGAYKVQARRADYREFDGS